MAPIKKPFRQLRRHFLKEWRKHRDLTQEQASERLDIDRTTLGRVENGKIPYSQGLLEAAADAYMCEPWDLLNIDPGKEGHIIDLVEIIKGATPEQKAEIIGYARGIVKR